VPNHSGGNRCTLDHLFLEDDTVKIIEAYQCSDGLVFDDEGRAKAHEDDLLGAELDGLLRLFELDNSRYQEQRSLLKVMGKRKELKQSIDSILQILEYTGG
jgi:hypothetical protein